MFAVETNIPVPESGLRNTKYPLAQLEVGHSYFVPGSGEVARRVAQAAYTYARTHDIKVRCMATDGGMRVWRVA
jgi:hypothetical protein